MTAFDGEELSDGQVCLLKTYDLHVVLEPWPYAVSNATAIADYWQRRVAENPKMFNGCIHVLLRHSVDDGVLTGQYARTDFASYLYWRESGFDDPPTCDGFASILLLNRTGGYLVARAAPHTLNAGYDVPPGGMIDERDVDTAGRIAVEPYALRELYEETGLTAQEVACNGEMWVARAGALLAMGLVCHSPLDDDVIIERVNAHNATEADAELSTARWFDAAAQSNDMCVPRFVRLLAMARAGALC